MIFEKLSSEYKSFYLNQCKMESSDVLEDFQNHG